MLILQQGEREIDESRNVVPSAKITTKFEKARTLDIRKAFSFKENYVPHSLTLTHGHTKCSNIKQSHQKNDIFI